MKKLINQPDDLVVEALQGMACAYPHLLRVNFDPPFVVRADAPVVGKVGIISGGGSGHEPLHVGYVGKGMLDAACPGAIFTSPTPDQVLAAMRAIDGGAGILQIVKNYTGDILNFDLATELAIAEGLEVRTVVIDDDVAVENSLYTAGRRGVGCTVLAERICGAAAEEGQSLARIALLGRRVRDEGRSMGVALTSCTVPAVGRPTFALAAEDIEMGIGIHGEPGRARVKLAPADEIAETLAASVLADLPFRRGDQVIALVNGMGGTPLIELYVVYRRLATICAGRGVTIVRNLVGNYITSLEMAGCSISLLRINDELLRLWDTPVRTPALSW